MIPLRYRKKIWVDPFDGCWVWQGAKNANGYGRVRMGGRVWLVHRLAFVVYKGDIKHQHDIHHTCANRLCCNPRHLEQVTHQENMKEMFMRRSSEKESRQAILFN